MNLSSRHQAALAWGVKDAQRRHVPAWRHAQRRPEAPCPHRGRVLQRCYVSTLKTLATDRARAERAERRLRLRLAQRATWPAALSALAGGSAMVLGLRLAGY